MEPGTLALVVVGAALVAGALGFVIAHLLARARGAAAETSLSTARAELDATKGEREQLRASLSHAERESAATRASLDAATEETGRLREELERAHARIDELSRERSHLERDLRALDERTRAELRAKEDTLAERERALVDLKATLEHAKATLADVFKATGADVLRTTAESLLKQAREQFDGQKQVSAAELDLRREAIEATVAPLKEQLKKHEELVKQLSEKREGDAKTIGEQLRAIAELQQKASSAAQSLSSALRDNRQRGRWGEVSLRNIAEMAGLSANVDFSEQSSLENDEGARLRPDMTVRLPGNRFVPVDAKVPMNAYLDSLDPDISDAQRLERRVAHAGALRTHVRALLSRDYARALGGGVEITVLFVPFESGLIAALEEDATIFDDALDKGVIITTSSTLLALLRTCALQWQQATLTENARKIGAQAKELLARITRFAEHLQKVGKNLDTATRSFNDAIGSFNARLLPSARSTAELAGHLEATPDDLSPVETAPRDVQLRLLDAGDDAA